MTESVSATSLPHQHDIRPAKGATHRRKRVGRGESSGWGKTSGRGHKGQNSRSGGGVRPGFEGGQIPLIRRIPIRGFTHKQDRPAIVNLRALTNFPDGASVNLDLLKEKGLIKKSAKRLRVLGDGEIQKPLEITTDQISANAKKKILAAGGKVIEARPLSKVVGKKEKPTK